jgi:NAD(P)-dependent dehydrogenase (short-subunit alcohol dehydrogenase family)
MSGWSIADMPSLDGETAVVTGANSGLGLVTARELARAGAEVVLACRNAEKGRAALEQVSAAASGPAPRLESLDLADLGSVRAFAARLAHGQSSLDLLVNNAGVMAPPRRETVDGFESQFGTNHLGHFALTGRLLGLLSSSADPRVVTMSSLAHRMGQIRFDDLQYRRHYNNWRAYGQSKLANLMFGLELARRAAAAGSPLRSLIAHPGYSATNLQFAGPAHVWEKLPMAVLNRVYAQSADMGALPELFAAVSDLPSGTFVGPDGLFEGRGHPHIVTGVGRAYDEEAAARLWAASAELTGVEFEFPAVPAA